MAIFGDDFASAGRCVYGLFERRGWGGIVLSEVCSFALSMGTLCVACFVALVTYFMACSFFSATQDAALPAIESFLVCFLMCT